VVGGDTVVDGFGAVVVVAGAVVDGAVVDGATVVDVVVVGATVVVVTATVVEGAVLDVLVGATVELVVDDGTSGSVVVGRLGNVVDVLGFVGAAGRTVGVVGATVTLTGEVVDVVDEPTVTDGAESGEMAGPVGLVGLVVCTMSSPLPVDVAVIRISCVPEVTRSSVSPGSECTVSTWAPASSDVETMEIILVLGLYANVTRPFGVFTTRGLLAAVDAGELRTKRPAASIDGAEEDGFDKPGRP
jgi:hypothetical protein